MKVMTIVGTRPEIIKLSRVIHKLDQYTEHILVHTGQNYDYELNQIFFEELEIRKPDHFLDVAADNATQTIANVMVKADTLFDEIKPDALLIYGDTNSCLCVIPAKRKKIPIFHMEAGNRCFDQRVPEEINRKIVDHLSDINMPLTEHARKYLLSEGLPAGQIIKTGSCMKEVFNYYKEKIEHSNILQKLNLQSKQFFVVSIHREENLDIDINFTTLIDSLDRLANIYSLPIVVSTHPRTMKKLQQSKKQLSPLIHFLKPFGFFDYITLQKNAYCVISDSGTITEEASLLHIPAITLRMAHERPEGMDAGVVIMSSMNTDHIINSIEVAIQTGIQSIPEDYNINNVSDKVIKIILSYTDYINRNTWKSDV